MTPSNPAMARYRVLRFLAACTEGGVTATRAYARVLCECGEAGFSGACESLASDGLATGLACRRGLDGSVDVSFLDPAPTREGWAALSDGPDMDAARRECGTAFECAVELAVAATRRIERIVYR